jgi:Ras-related protein Rab-7A
LETPGLERVDLSGCDSVTDDVLFRAMKGCQQLQSLKLQGCTRITYPHLKEIAPLTFLDLISSLVSPYPFFEFDLTDPNLSEIDISNHGLHYSDVERLINGLKKNSNLLKLSLSYSNRSEFGLNEVHMRDEYKPLESLLEINYSIKSILLRNEPIEYSPRQKLLKCILLGDSETGKTELIRAFVNKKFSNQYKATIGADFLTKEMKVDDHIYTLQIWDTAGAERFQSGNTFYRGADILIICFTVTIFSTFEHVDRWLEAFKIQTLKPDIPIVLVGTGIERENERVVNRKIAEAKAKEIGADYVEVNNKECINVYAVFDIAVRKYIEGSINLNSENVGKKLKRNRDLQVKFHEAVQQNNLHDVMQCIEQGVSLLSTNSIKETALHQAVINGNVAITQLLIKVMLKRNMKFAIKDGQGKTPLDLAQTRGCVAIVKLLQMAEHKSYEIKPSSSLSQGDNNLQNNTSNHKAAFWLKTPASKAKEGILPKQEGELSPSDFKMI